MALNENEQLGGSLLGRGGVEAPLEEQPGETQVAMSRIPQKLGRAGADFIESLLAPKDSGDVLRSARQKIKQKQNQQEPPPGADSSSGGGEPAAPDAAPVVDEPPAVIKEGQPADPLSVEPQPESAPQAKPDLPRQFIVDDPYEGYIKVNDDDVNSVMEAPANRDELLAGGLSDFNGTKLPDEAGIQERIEAISQRYSGKITEGKRDEISREATRQMADLVGMNPRKLTEAILNRKSGQAIEVEGMGLAETILAARDLLVSEMRKLDGLAEVAKTGSEEDLLRFKYQMELVANLQANVKGAQTEIARALGQFNIPAQSYQGLEDPVMAQQFAMQARTRNFTQMLEEMGGPGNIRSLAEAYTKLDDPSQRSAFTRFRWRKVFNAAYEVWQHALLTNPITQTKNIIGGVIGTFVMPMAEGLTAVGMGQVRKLAGTATDDVFEMGDLQARLFGQSLAMREAFMKSASAFTNMGSDIDGFKVERAREGRVPAFSGEAFGQNGALGTTIDVLGNIFTMGRVSFRTLEAGDTFFKVVAQRATMYEEAFRRGRMQGLEGEELSDFIAEAVVNPPPEMQEKAIAVAKYQTLQTDMDNAGRSLQTLQRVPLVRYAVPFLKTPYNASKYTFVDRSPLGIFYGETAAMLRAGGKQKDEAIARLAVSAGIGFAVYQMWGEGRITGGGPTDPSLRALYRASGWQPYSIRVGDEYFSYAGMEPLSSILGVIVDGAEIITNVLEDDDELTFNDIAGAAVGATFYNVSNKTFMEGFSNIVALTQDPQRYSGRYFEQIGTSLVPRVVAYAERLDDPVVRHARDYMDDLRAQIPGLSKNLKPRVDLMGNDIHAGNYNPDTKSYDLAAGADFISPFYRSKIKDQTVMKAATALKGLSLTRAPEEFTPPGSDEPIKFTDEERYFFHKRAHSLGWSSVTAAIKTPDFQKLLERAKGSKTLRERLRFKLQSIWIDARETALAETINHPKFGPNIARLMRLRAQQRDKTLTQEMEGL